MAPLGSIYWCQSFFIKKFNLWYMHVMVHAPSHVVSMLRWLGQQKYHISPTGSIKMQSFLLELTPSCSSCIESLGAGSESEGLSGWSTWWSVPVFQRWYLLVLFLKDRLCILLVYKEISRSADYGLVQPRELVQLFQTIFSEFIAIELAQKWREKRSKYSEIVFTSLELFQLSYHPWLST